MLIRGNFFAFKDGEGACRTDNKLTQYSSCILSYIERQMRCKIPWNSNNQTAYDLCSSKNKTLEYLNISKKISIMNDFDVADKTGCHIPCMMNEYSAK